MFQKIKFKLTNVDFERLKGSVVTSFGRPPRPTLTYYRLNDYEYFQSLLPEKMFYGTVAPFQVQLAEITGSGHLLPHIDHNISACANYYLDTNGSTTHFYNKKPNAQGFVYPGRTVANIYSLDQVTQVGEFTAEPDELYLLDVSQIHSVNSPNNGIRRFITWQWVDTPFESIKNTLLENLT
jgi:hypothetical protein